MTSEPPDIKVGARYPIGEAAKILGVSPRHLLRMTTEGLIKYSVNRRNGRKYFLGEELLRCWHG